MESERNFLYVMSTLSLGLWGYCATLLLKQNEAFDKNADQDLKEQDAEEQDVEEQDVNQKTSYQEPSYQETHHQETHTVSPILSQSSAEDHVNQDVFSKESDQPTRLQDHSQQTILATPKKDHLTVKVAKTVKKAQMRARKQKKDYARFVQICHDIAAQKQSHDTFFEKIRQKMRQGIKKIFHL